MKSKHWLEGVFDALDIAVLIFCATLIVRWAWRS